MSRINKEFGNREGQLLDDISFLRKRVEKREEEITLLKLRMKKGGPVSGLTSSQDQDRLTPSNEVIESL